MNIDIDNYLHGECHIFAMALSLEKGYKIELAIDSNDLEINREVLIHAYCLDNNNRAVDVNGISDRDNILDDFDYNEEYFITATIDDIKQMIKDGFLHAPKEGQIEEIREFIRFNKAF